MEYIEEIADLVDEHKRRTAALAEKTRSLFAPALKQFLTDFPTVKAIAWRQHTPHFNDGEPCVFGLHGVFFTASEEPNDSIYDDGWFEAYELKYNPDVFDKTTTAACKKLSELIESCEPQLQEIFGDGVQVSVTAKGIRVEEYDHD